MKTVLLVVNVQNDFISGVLGTAEAVHALPNITKKVMNFEGEVIFTRDTHDEDYLHTQEGRLLPIEHCLYGTEGWKIPASLYEYCKEHGCRTFDKGCFGSAECAMYVSELYAKDEIDKIIIIGYCTDICVISNALLIKSFVPELPIYVDAQCCAGVTADKHANALDIMDSCHIIVENK